MKQSNFQILQEVQVRDTIIKAHVVDSEHKFDYPYLVPTLERTCLSNYSD